MSDVVMVTGMSGAGRTTCLKMLEDLGFEAVDNLPVNLIGRVPRPGGSEPQQLAIGFDGGTRGFSPQKLLDALRLVSAQSGRPPMLLFLEADDEVLRRRFTETRRRHPLSEIHGVGEALAA